MRSSTFLRPALASSMPAGHGYIGGPPRPPSARFADAAQKSTRRGAGIAASRAHAARQRGCAGAPTFGGLERVGQHIQDVHAGAVHASHRKLSQLLRWCQSRSTCAKAGSCSVGVLLRHGNDGNGECSWRASARGNGGMLQGSRVTQRGAAASARNQPGGWRSRSRRSGPAGRGGSCGAASAGKPQGVQGCQLLCLQLPVSGGKNGRRGGGCSGWRAAHVQA